MPKEYKNHTGILTNVHGRTQSDAAKGWLMGNAGSDEGAESRVHYEEVNVEDITPRLINKYSQSRIERLAKSIRSTNNRLIHPIVLVKPEDLPEDSPLLKKINETGKSIDKKYIIVAGERRYHAWMLNRKLEQEKIDKSGFSRENPFDTITANILTAEEAKHEEIYYSDSNTEARQLTPVEGMLNVKDALDTIRTNEEKREALIQMNNGSEEGISDDPDAAAKKFNTNNYVMYYLENELGITGWAPGTIKQYLAVVNNCAEEVIDAIIDGEYTERQSRRITSLSKEKQLELLELWKNDEKEDYEKKLKKYLKPETKKVRVTHRDAQRQIKAIVKSMRKERDKLEEIKSKLGEADREELKRVIKKMDGYIEEMEESEKAFK